MKALIGLVVALLVLSGCAALQPSAQPAAPAPKAPDGDEALIKALYDAGCDVKNFSKSTRTGTVQVECK